MYSSGNFDFSDMLATDYSMYNSTAGYCWISDGRHDAIDMIYIPIMIHVFGDKEQLEYDVILTSCELTT